MTNEEIVRRVAEVVMGWVQVEDVFFPNKVWAMPDKSILDFRVPDFDPLTDLNHAFMVVEKMREMEWNMEMEVLVGEMKSFVKFLKLGWGKVPNMDSGFFAHKDTGHAICLAALKAKGVAV